MGETQEVQLHVSEAEQAAFPKDPSQNDSPSSSSILKAWRWWLIVSLYTAFILGGQTAATLLGRLYYEAGGKSLWMATVVQSAGAPLLIPLLFRFPSSHSSSHSPRRSTAKFAAVCTGIGLLIAGDNLMYSYGLLYLPVSTYSLLCATQLGFSAAFSFFLNSQKFTPLILNSVALLTLSAALLGVRSDTGGAANGDKQALGFVLTLAASAAFALILSLLQLTFQKLLKTETFSVVLEIIIFTNVVATAAAAAGLFAGGDWRGISAEFAGYEKGRVSYVMTLVWIAICWTVYSVGAVGLIFMASSLFANVIATTALPLVPVFAVVFFHERIDGVKVVALLIATVGFVNYGYQHYLDDLKQRKKTPRTADDL
ncbi:putative purine permease 9 [Apostasia shenzhenica]|uniref:Probable purine permease n=1 Tax=Apostasia shenzhenica TaxID=1088818 RepID=A0A2I0ATK2_9ASPA|nr:putative purine permease 9 [Apostasia shenzhenica]